MLNYFSDDYAEARRRFCLAAERAGARVVRYPIGDDEGLSIDVALIGCDNADRVVVVSSGVHGVEGPFGSAVQLAWLQRAAERKLQDRVGVVLIHAINPFGFAHHRRWNEDGVDLNRNFLLDDQTYAGAPHGYKNLDSLLNPRSAPSRWEPFGVKAAWYLVRYGAAAMKDAIATGQYEYPRGLFFGGTTRTASARIISDHYAEWLGDARAIVHLDLHTGLGRFAEYRMLLETDPASDEYRWFSSRFGPELVEPGQSEGTAYRARGTLGQWAAVEMRDRKFRFATVDFGTYGLVRVLRALRAENRVHHFGNDDARHASVRHELRECFCPTSPKWRSKMVQSALDVVDRAIDAESP